MAGQRGALPFNEAHNQNGQIIWMSTAAIRPMIASDKAASRLLSAGCISDLTQSQSGSSQNFSVQFQLGHEHFVKVCIGSAF
jgi:hypothetical protein